MLVTGGFILTAALVVLFLYYGATFFSNHALPGTTINGIKIGFDEKKVIIQKLNDLLINKKKEPLYFSIANNFFERSLEETGFIIEIDRTVDQIFDYWKESSPVEKLRKFLNGFVGNGLAHKLLVKFNEERFQKFVKVFEPFETKPIDYSLIFDGYNFNVIEGRDGYMVDTEALRKEIERTIWLSSKQVVVPQKIVKPEIGEEEVLSMRAKINDLLEGAPYLVKFKDKTWSLERQDIGTFIIFKKETKGKLTYDLDKEKIVHFVNLLAPQINLREQDATLSYDKDNKIIVVDKGQVGLEVDIDENTDLIYQALMRGEKEITLKITEILPRVTSQTLQELGIEKLLGVGRTSFDGSPSSRIHNITIGTSKFNKILIPPNATFSFNEILGTVGPESGYKAELVIKDNKIYPEYGGGLCQVSTTLFRAAVNSGLDVVQRSPHSIMVRYYNPAGFDAAIYPPNPDLKFKNNTSGHLYVQARVVKNEVVFEIYGKNEGKIVKINGPVFVEKNDDGAAKTLLIQEVWQDGKLILKKQFYSSYKPYNMYPVLRNPLE